MTDPSQVRIAGPLAPFATGFTVELQRHGYTQHTVCSHLRLLAHLSRWLANEGLDPHQLLPHEAQRFLKARRGAGHTASLTSGALVPLLTYLEGLGVTPPAPPPPPPAGAVEELLDRFRRYLTVERGLEDESAHGYTRAIRPFLSERTCMEGLGLSGLSAADATSFALARCRHQSAGTAQKTLTALRSLLGFLHLEGEIEKPLATAVPSIPGWRLVGLPRGLEPAQVRSLLGACDRGSAKGRRDFAILTMLIRLGLRAGEVGALGLDDIDWRAGEIVVRGKGREERLPLPDDVGEAIAAYLRDGRPAGAQGRTVFVWVTAPYRALSRGGISTVVAAAARRAGLEQIRAHRLRHTAATEMLRAGASLPEVGQLLRHRHVHTTAIYAKVDRKTLRRLARPWPGGVA